MDIKFVIVCLGAWNKKLFSPPWVAKVLFDLPDGADLLAEINTSELELTFKHRNVALTAKDKSLEIQVLNAEKSSIEYSNELLLRILQLLPQTPIGATGFNIQYELDNKEINSTLLSKVDLHLKPMDNFHVDQIRFIKQDTDHELRLMFNVKDNNKLTISFNYHYKDYIFSSKPVFYKHFEDSKKWMEL